MEPRTHRGEVDVLLSERREQDKINNPPVDWAGPSAEQAAAQWPILARWVGDVLVPRYELTRDELPDCCALHPPVVTELSWLRTAYVQAYLTRSPGPQCHGRVLEPDKDIRVSTASSPVCRRSGSNSTSPRAGVPS